MTLLGTPQHIEDEIHYEIEDIGTSLAEYAEELYYADKNSFKSDSLDELFRIPNDVKSKLSSMIKCNREKCIKSMGPLCIDGKLIGIDLVNLPRTHNGKHKITKFPDFMEFCDTLYEIKIPDQLISNIPKDLGTFPCLHTLAIQNNKISKLSPYFHDNFPNLQDLRIQGNPIIRHNPDFFANDSYHNISRIRVSPDKIGNIDKNTFNIKGGDISIYNFDSTEMDEIYILSDVIQYLSINFINCKIDKPLQFRFNKFNNLSGIYIRIDETEIINFSSNFIDKETATCEYFEAHLSKCIIHDINLEFISMFDKVKIFEYDNEYVDNKLLNLNTRINRNT